MIENTQEEMLQRHFISNEDKGREDFKRRIANLAKYYRDLNVEYKFACLPRNALYNKLKENKKKLLEETNKKRHYYLKGKKNHCFYNKNIIIYIYVNIYR